MVEIYYTIVILYIISKLILWMLQIYTHSSNEKKTNTTQKNLPTAVQQTDENRLFFIEMMYIIK